MIRNGFFLGRSKGTRTLPGDNFLYITSNNQVILQDFNKDSGWGNEYTLLSNVDRVTSLSSSTMIVRNPGNYIFDSYMRYYSWNKNTRNLSLVYEETSTDYGVLNNAGNVLVRTSTLGLSGDIRTNDWNNGLGNIYSSPVYTNGTGFWPFKYLSFSPSDDIFLFAGNNSSSRELYQIYIYNWDKINGYTYQKGHFINGTAAITYPPPWPLTTQDVKVQWHPASKSFLVCNPYTSNNYAELYYRDSYNSNNWIYNQFVANTITNIFTYSNSGNYVVAKSHDSNTSLIIVPVLSNIQQYKLDPANATVYSVGSVINDIAFNKTGDILFVSSANKIIPFAWNDTTGILTAPYTEITFDTNRYPRDMKSII